jgi:glycosyltransferase involved in cell wall biosynthesis
VSEQRDALSITHVVVTRSFAGVERYVCQVSNQLAARGHRVTAIGGDAQRMEHELDSSVVRRPAASLIGASLAIAGDHDTDVLHLHMTAAEIAAWVARPANRAPRVATRHFAQDRGSHPVSRAVARLSSRGIACDIAISQFVADSISGPSVLLPNGVDDQPQAALESSGVVMLQRLDVEKAPEVGIRAWALSGLGERGWELSVAGEGVLRPSLTELARQLGVDHSVRFLGLVSDTETLLDGSSILLAPAPREPFGLSVVEAMAHGLPVVAAAGGAHVETLGDAAALFPPGDAPAAAEALIALTDRASRLPMGERLRQRQRERYSLSGHVDRLENIYRQVARTGRLVAGSAPC